MNEEWLPPIGFTQGELADAEIAGPVCLFSRRLSISRARCIGQCCFRAGTAKCTFGTGAFLLLHTGDQPVWSKHGLLTTPACATSAVTTYALDGGIYVAGAAVTWMRDSMHLIATDADAGALAESVPDSGGVTCIPSLAGLAAPYWERRARGMFLWTQ